MNVVKRIAISAVLVGLPLSALADNDHYRGQGHSKGHHEQNYQRDGHGNSRHNSHPPARHSRHDHHGHNRHQDRHAHQERHVHQERVYVPTVVHAPAHEPSGVTVHGNVRIPF